MTLQAMPNTSIFQEKEFIFRTKDSSFPFKRDVKNCGFENPRFEILPLNARISDLSMLLGFSKSAFFRKLKEGAIRIEDNMVVKRKVTKDELLDSGITRMRVRRLIVNIWFLKTWKRKFIDYMNYVLEPIIYYPVNRITNKLFGRVWF